MQFRLYPAITLIAASTVILHIKWPAGGFSHPDRSPNPLVEPARPAAPLVFVSRNPIVNDDPGAVPGFGPLYRTAIVGGKLLVQRENGTIDHLASHLFDVSDPSVSWDAKTIIFAGVAHPDSNWRIYGINADGSGLLQLTKTDRGLDLKQFGAAASRFERYDDFDPCFLPDGRIVFASTRYPLLASYNALPASNLFVMNADGSGLRRITTERNGADEPVIDPMTGRVVYARWWANLDRPSNITRNGLSRVNSQTLTEDEGNLWHAVTIKPDGDEVRLYAGFARERAGMQTYKPSIMDDGRLISTYTADFGLADGTGGMGIRLFDRGPNFEKHVVGLRSGVAPANARPPFALGGVQYGKETLLFSYSEDGEDYGIYTCHTDGSGLRRIVDLPGTLELDAQPLLPRPVPPILVDEFEHEPSQLPPTEDPQTHFKDDFFRFDCMNIFTNAGVDEPIPDAPRITRNARIKFFMNVQRQNPRTPDPSIFLKDAPVFYHGGVHEHDVPAEVPLFEQVVDEEGRVLQTTDGRFAHVAGFNYERQGAGTKCVGCHIGHSMMEVPINGTIAEWFNAAPSARVTASSYLVDELGRSFHPQRIVDRQARTGGDTVVWIAREQTGAWVELQWDIPVEVREFILYGIPVRSSSATTLDVKNCEIVLYRDGREVSQIKATGRIMKDGTSVPVKPVMMDAARITLTQGTGKVLGYEFLGLAEVEAIVRLTAEDTATKKGS